MRLERALFWCVQRWTLWTDPTKADFQRENVVRQTGQRSVQDWSFALEYLLKLNSVASVHGFGLRQERQWRNLQTRPE